MSVSDNCFQLGISVGYLPLFLPFSRTWICSAFGPLTTGEPSSAAKALGTPLPVAWWQTTQLVEYTFSPRVFSSSMVQTLFGSSARAAIFFCWSATHTL